NEELNNYMLQGMGKTFEDLRKEVVIHSPEVRYKKYEETGFKTPSGKVELYSSMLEEHGYDPLPFYEENPETPVSAPELAKEYPLILITGSRHVVYFHAANRNIPWLREIVPDPCLEIHPETAERLGIKEGDWVWVEGPYERGRVKMKADITEAVDPRVVHAYSHWWFPERKDDDPLMGAFDSNINVILTNDPPYDPVSGGTPLRGNLCKVYRAEENVG
ncbi:MAG: molybdopterin dinucleotide binding domain-containing protein, partial [Nitrospinota bacterium]